MSVKERIAALEASHAQGDTEPPMNSMQQRSRLQRGSAQPHQHMDTWRQNTSSLSPEQYADAIFDEIDVNGDGVISRAELQNFEPQFDRLGNPERFLEVERGSRFSPGVDVFDPKRLRSEMADDQQTKEKRLFEVRQYIVYYLLPHSLDGGTLFFVIACFSRQPLIPR